MITLLIYNQYFLLGSRGIFSWSSKAFCLSLSPTLNGNSQTSLRFSLRFCFSIKPQPWVWFGVTHYVMPMFQYSWTFIRTRCLSTIFNNKTAPSSIINLNVHIHLISWVFLSSQDYDVSSLDCDDMHHVIKRNVLFNHNRLSIRWRWKSNLKSTAASLSIDFDDEDEETVGSKTKNNCICTLANSLKIIFHWVSCRSTSNFSDNKFWLFD